MIFVTHNYAPKVLQPRKESLDFPASFVAAQNSPLLCWRTFAIRFVWRDQFNAKFLQLVVERIRVICFVANHLMRSLIGKAFNNSSLDEFDFVRRSRVCVDGERKTKAVCHCQELRAFAPLGLSDRKAPFLADTNVPSMKVSDKSNLPRSSKSWAKVSSTFRSLPSLTHCWKRRWQVWLWRKAFGQILPTRSRTQNPQHAV